MKKLIVSIFLIMVCILSCDERSETEKESEKVQVYQSEEFDLQYNEKGQSTVNSKILDGKVEVRFDNGGLFSEATYKNGIQVGEEKTYYQFIETTQTITQFNDEGLVIKMISYTPNEQIFDQTDLKNGEGMLKIPLDNSGKLNGILEVKDNKIVTKTVYYTNGKIETKSNFKYNGKIVTYKYMDIYDSSSKKTYYAELNLITDIGKMIKYDENGNGKEFKIEKEKLIEVK